MVGAAQVLLHPDWGGNVVIVGGPGQGKTTLLQYISQFYRARILEKNAYHAETSDLNPVTSTLRTPLKLDLPDFAEWRRVHDGKASLTPSSGVQSLRRRTSLEFYICSVLSELSEAEFTVEDFAKFAARNPLLLALDGLDEVANAKARGLVADEIREAAARLTASGLDVQVVVATRPGLVGRPLWRDSEFETLFLQQLTPALRMKYLDRWTGQARLDEREKLICEAPSPRAS